MLIVRDTDVPAYVEQGAADLGIAGRDVLEEQGRDLYEPLDLASAAAAWWSPSPKGGPVDEKRAASTCATPPSSPRSRAATCRRAAPSPRSSSSTARSRSRPLVGLADRIVDLVSSGETLRQHRLREVETILDVTSHLRGTAPPPRYGDRIDALLARLGGRRLDCVGDGAFGPPARGAAGDRAEKAQSLFDAALLKSAAVPRSRRDSRSSACSIGIIGCRPSS